MATTMLNSWQMRGLQKLGDAYVPGDKDLPSFSRLGCAEHVDSVLECMGDQDRSDLKLLLTVFSFLPIFSLALFMRQLENVHHLPTWAGGGFLRLVRLGLKGLVMTLYWSGLKGKAYTGPSPLESIDFRISVVGD